MEKKRLITSFMVRLGIFFVWSGLIAVVLIVPRLRFVERNAITVFVWSGIFSQEYIKKFEEQTGIRVYVSYYASNEELLVKLRATGGRGYDLVMPSDYAVKKLIDEGLLKKIDKQKLNFVETLNPLLMGHSFDPHNDYAIPFVWELYLMGLTQAFLQQHNVTANNAWDLIFKPQIFGKDYRLIMVNDPVDAIATAAHYLFGVVEPLTDEQAQQVQDLLKAQRPWVEAYSNVRSDYFLGTHNAMSALTHSAEMWRALRDYKGVDFVVPQDTFITVEHCAIPTASDKDDLVYQFLNFFYTKESFEKHFDEFKSCPARLDVIDELDATERQKDIMKPTAAAFKHYMFMRDIVSEQLKHNLWISVKT